VWVSERREGERERMCVRERRDRETQERDREERYRERARER